MKTRITILFGLISAALPAFSAEPTKEQLDFFEAKIRPIFSNNCYKCHAVETGKSKGGLTLDTEGASQKGGDTGPAVVPGNLEKSLLYTAINYTDKDMEMPPSSSGGKLSAAQIADVAAWIKMGAPDPRKTPTKSGKLSGMTDKARAHWAYQPVKRGIAVPVNKNQQWCRTPIDAFILQKLEANGMFASPDAGKETLLRRGYYDLIGLPPSPAEIEAFVADKSANAWEKVVDRLLANPHYGERWARHWLDTARYADTVGGDANTNNGRDDYRYANAWTYRDYVVRAFNEDKPYDLFITEQLAADYLYPLKPVGTPAVAKVEAKPAAPAVALKSTPPAVAVALPPVAIAPKTTGAATAVADPFNLSPKSAGNVAKANLAPPPAPMKSGSAAAKSEALMQPAMMSGDSMMMMGGASASSASGPEMEGSANLAALGFITVGERFNNINDIINDRIDVVGRGLVGLTVACARCHDHMFDPISQKDYYALHGIFSSTVEPKEKPLITAADPKARADFEQKIVAVEKENRDIYFREVEHWLDLWKTKPAQYLKAALLRDGKDEKMQLERQEIIKSEQLDNILVNYYGRAVNPNSRVYGPLSKFKNIQPSEFSTQGALVLKDIAGSGRYNPLVVKAIQDAKPSSMNEVTEAYYNLLNKVAPKITGLVKAYQSATTDKVEVCSKDELEILIGAFEIAPAPKVDSTWIRTATGNWPVQLTGRARFVFAKVNELELTHPGAPARAMAVRDSANIKNSNVFIRGQAGQQGEMVPRRFLDILSPDHQSKPFSLGSGRLELAKAITSKDNPLTARVMVNRVWLHHFGEGFVRTPDDLGVMSEAPSHPELIDYLAGWFMDNGWSIKKLHKFIMLSRVYQESSYILKDAGYANKDPDNRFLWRANVRRLDFECVRDSLLTFSGRLDQTIGGQPVNITDEPYIYRRSIYGYIDRGNLSELMGHFDFSDPDMPNSKRTTTIVPQQALFLMNSPMAVDVARRVIARPEVAHAGTDLHRVFAIYSILFQRQPTMEEIKIGVSYVQNEAKKQPEVDAMGAELAKKNLEIAKRIEDRRKRNDDGKKTIENTGSIVERKTLNPWESYAHALLFANESAYIN